MTIPLYMCSIFQLPTSAPWRLVSTTPLARRKDQQPAQLSVDTWEVGESHRAFNENDVK